jgi:chemotaxis protein histidine kinase CheA
MDSFADTLWNEFAVETDEHLQAVEPILVQSDAEAIGAAEIAQLFRSFHSIKGLARAMSPAWKAWRITRKTCSAWCATAAPR